MADCKIVDNRIDWACNSKDSMACWDTFAEQQRQLQQDHERQQYVAMIHPYHVIDMMLMVIVYKLNDHSNPTNKSISHMHHAKQ